MRVILNIYVFLLYKCRYVRDNPSMNIVLQCKEEAYITDPLHMHSIYIRFETVLGA